ncbi:MAG: glycosyltransferase family 2 protein, partial [Tepidisphaeraceae bacterium]
DDTQERLKPLLRDDPRFSVLPSPRRGAQAARNVGIEAARGKYVMLLDSDDLLAGFCIEQRVPVMEADPTLDFAVFPCECFRKTPGDTRLLWNVPTNETDLDRFLKLDVPWQTTSPLWRRDAIMDLLPWPEDVPVGQDWEFHIRALLKDLRYTRHGRPDHYWRMAESERESIGKQTMKPEMLLGRLKTNEQVLAHVKAAGKLKAPARDAFAGMFFQSAERLGTRVSWREGLRTWARARELDLINDKQFTQGRTYFWLYRFKRLRTRYRSHLERVWPAAFFARKSSTYLKAPVETPTEIAA